MAVRLNEGLGSVEVAGSQQAALERTWPHVEGALQAEPAMDKQRERAAVADGWSAWRYEAAAAGASGTAKADAADPGRWCGSLRLKKHGSEAATTSALLGYMPSEDGPQRWRDMPWLRSRCGRANSWLFNSRRKALTLLAYCTAPIALPNVRVKRPPAAWRLGRLDDDKQHGHAAKATRRWRSA